MYSKPSVKDERCTAILQSQAHAVVPSLWYSKACISATACLSACGWDDMSVS